SVQTNQPVVSTPTTLGAATGAMVGGPSRGRGALIGGVAALSVIGIVIGVVLASRGGDDKKSVEPAKDPAPTATSIQPPQPPPPQPPVVVDAGVAATPPTPDAAVAASTPIDAGVAAVTPPPPVKKTPTKRPPKKKEKDVGDSRD
ncbi:MAG: hypothetical protein H0T65_11675, partial [Deltaproteobacteria bacterium]|nr:hypothetical protein [Deltaproteobacteria bacterium]